MHQGTYGGIECDAFREFGLYGLYLCVCRLRQFERFEFFIRRLYFGAFISNELDAFHAYLQISIDFIVGRRIACIEFHTFV
jgi:hypothetical protein